MLANRKIFFHCLLFILYSQVLFSQDILRKEVTIKSRIHIADQLLDSLHKDLNVVFVYSDIIKPSRKITISPGEYSLKQVLDSILTIRDFQYITRKNLVILSPQSPDNNGEERYVVKGKVMNKREKPIPFATIYFRNSSKGTIANGEGEFRFIIPASMSDDTLFVSSVGYENVKIAPEIYLSQSLQIHLKNAVIPIKDIIVRPEIPDEIVMKSWDDRFKNYNTKPLLLTAFFRETSKQNDDYISLTEALIEINKSSYTSNAEDLIKLVKGRNGTNINQSELVNLVVQGGLYNGLRLDIAKYGSYFFGKDALQECNYRMVKTTFFQGRQTYIIGFEMKPGLNYAGYKGNLYFDAENLALVRAEFELSPEGIKFAKSALVKKTPKGFSARPVSARYEVEYRYYNNVWNLHYAHSEVDIKVKRLRAKGKRSFSCNFVSTSEFVITGIDKNPSDRIRYREAAHSNDVLVKQVQNTNESFWSDDNIIIPEEPLLSTIEKLQKKGLIPSAQSADTKQKN